MTCLIGKQRKPLTIGETLVKPAALHRDILLEKAATDKLALVPLSNKVVKSRINDISEDILNQVVADLKTLLESSACSLAKQLTQPISTSLLQLCVMLKGTK